MKKFDVFLPSKSITSIKSKHLFHFLQYFPHVAVFLEFNISSFCELKSNLVSSLLSNENAIN